MQTRRTALLSVALVLLILASSFGLAAADYSVAVKGGDWVKWKVSTVGSPGARARNLTAARMDVLNVEDELISVKLSTQYANGTVVLREITLNQLKGSTEDGLVVPRNLNVGDQFFDKYQGNITISGVRQMSFGGAQRNVMFGSKGNTTYCWDRETGVMINATSILTRYTMVMQLISTNIWEPDIFGLEPTIFYVIVVAVAVAAGVVVGIVVVRRVKNAKRTHSQLGKGAYYLRELQAAKRSLP
jgi:hypothetical protein